MGVQHGEQARELIAHNRPVFVKQTLEELRPYAAACEKWLAQMAPDELEEMRGIAEGSGQDLAVILAMNQVNTFGPEWLGQCTSMAISGGPDGPVLGKNNDGGDNPAVETKYIVRRSRPATGLPMVQVTYAGWLSGLDAMNAEGLANAHDSVGSVFDKSGPRLDVRLRVYQLMRRCRATTEMLEGLCQGPSLTGKGFAVIVVDKSGDTVAVEAAVPVIAWRNRRDPYVFATNHFITPALQNADMRTPEGKRVSSCRLGYLEWVARTRPPRSAEDIRAILRCHEPWAPCRHAGPHLSQTEWSIVGLPTQGKLLLAPGHPCENAYKAFDVA